MNNYISIILPCYNSEDYLKYTLDSIDRQNCYLELIFIDDASSDTSLSIIQNYTFNNKIELKIIKHAKNRGFISCLIEGIHIAKYEYIARIDSDDIWEPCHLKVLTNILKNCPSIALIGSDANIINESNEIMGEYITSHTHNSIIKNLCNDNPFIHSSVIFKKSIYNMTCGYSLSNIKDVPKNVSIQHIADYYLWFEFSKYGECTNLPIKTVRYRITKKSMSRKMNKRINYISRLWVMKKVHNKYNKYKYFSLRCQLKIKIKILLLALINK